MKANPSPLLLALALSLLPAGLTAESDADRDARLQWWREARFGMFIHWGPVSLKGTEIGWSRGAQIPVEEYDQLYRRFNPTNFNARAWAELARAAGMKYMVFTTKHHDGFCMWDTKQTDFNIMRSPFGRDVVKELAAGCRDQGLRFATYHSVCDWHHPDFPLTSPGGRVRRETSDLDRYEQYLHAQVRELITNYGPLGILWFDVPQEFDRERGLRLEAHTRALQPDIIINNRSGASGDYDTPEQRVGKYQDDRPWETCMTICRQWAWKPDDAMKSLEECLQTLIRCAGGDGNLLFNVGPMPDGRIEPRQVERLREMGTWLGQFGETIYATRGGPFKPGPWGASTRKDRRIYLHLFDPAEPLVLPPIGPRIVASSTLTGGSARVVQTGEGITVSVPEAARREIDTIVVLELDGPATTIPAVGLYPASLTSGRPATASNVFMRMSQYAAAKAVDEDDGTRWATDSGTPSAWIEVDLGQPTLIGRVRIDEAFAGRVRSFTLDYRDGDEWKPILAGSELGEHFTQGFPPVTARVVRLSILEATEGPTLNEFALYPPK
ncbi:MAG: alpha-L-fucosidase [Verrucomicrobiales bacterium]|nr:alpha-L-fucosidase [Verrucomicrobiales bacterium]